MKARLLRYAVTAFAVVCGAANAQTITQPRLNVMADAEKFPGKIIVREAKVLNVTKTTFDAVDEAGRKYVFPLEPGAPPPAPNSRIKIKITISIRPPGGGIEISW